MPSALPLLYPADGIDGYPREAFLNDLADQAEADIRGCPDGGAHVVQRDFAENRLALKLDPSGGVLDDFIALNNRIWNVSPQPSGPGAPRMSVGVRIDVGGLAGGADLLSVTVAAVVGRAHVP